MQLHVTVYPHPPPHMWTDITLSHWLMLCLSLRLRPYTLETTPFRQNSILATIDICSVYLNIPLDEDTSECLHLLEDRDAVCPKMLCEHFLAYFSNTMFIFPHIYLHKGNRNGHQDGPLLLEHFYGLPGNRAPWEWAPSTSPLEVLHQRHPLCMVRF